MNLVLNYLKLYVTLRIVKHANAGVSQGNKYEMLYIV